MSSDNSEIKIVYVLLDGVGDLPHPDIDNKTPLENAITPNLDQLTKNGQMGEVISGCFQKEILLLILFHYRFYHRN